MFSSIVQIMMFFALPSLAQSILKPRSLYELLAEFKGAPLPAKTSVSSVAAQNQGLKGFERMLLKWGSHDLKNASVSIEDLKIQGSLEEQELMIRKLIEYRIAKRANDDEMGWLEDDLAWAKELGVEIPDAEKLIDLDKKIEKLDKGSDHQSHQELLQDQLAYYQTLPQDIRETLLISQIPQMYSDDALKFLIEHPNLFSDRNRTTLVLRVVGKYHHDELMGDPNLVQKAIELIRKALSLVDFSKLHAICLSANFYYNSSPHDDRKNLSAVQKEYFGMITKGLKILQTESRVNCSEYISKEDLLESMIDAENTGLIPRSAAALVSNGPLAEPSVNISDCGMDRNFRNEVMVQLRRDEQFAPGKTRLWGLNSSGNCSLSVTNAKRKVGYQTQIRMHSPSGHILIQVDEKFMDIGQIASGILDGRFPLGMKAKPSHRVLSL